MKASFTRIFAAVLALAGISLLGCSSQGGGSSSAPGSGGSQGGAVSASGGMSTGGAAGAPLGLDQLGRCHERRRRSGWPDPAPRWLDGPGWCGQQQPQFCRPDSKWRQRHERRDHRRICRQDKRCRWQCGRRQCGRRQPGRRQPGRRQPGRRQRNGRTSRWWHDCERRIDRRRGHWRQNHDRRRHRRDGRRNHGRQNHNWRARIRWDGNRRGDANRGRCNRRQPGQQRRHDPHQGLDGGRLHHGGRPHHRLPRLPVRLRESARSSVQQQRDRREQCGRRSDHSNLALSGRQLDPGCQR